MAKEQRCKMNNPKYCPNGSGIRIEYCSCEDCTRDLKIGVK